jgi:hypothetical protein
LRITFQPRSAASRIVAWLDAPSQTGNCSWSGRVAIVVGRSTGKNSPSKVKSLIVSARRTTSRPSSHARRRSSSLRFRPDAI